MDGKLRIEEQLSRIIAWLEIHAEEQIERQKVYAKQHEEWKEKERREKELWDRKQNELLAFKRLINDAARWERVKMMRNYINEVEAITKANERTSSEEIENWLNWARNKVDWYDPYVDATDELLTDVDKETLDFKIRIPRFSL